MILNKKLKTLLVLAFYVGFTIAIYAIVCHFIDKPFQEIHLLYAVLIGCIAYLPVFIAEKKKKYALSSFFRVPDALIREQFPPVVS